jgi:RHS repeat-associated protein
VNPLVQSLTRPNGSVTTYQYNGLNQLTEIVNKTSTDDMLNQHVFTYNTLDLRGSETISGSALPLMPSLPEETRDYDYNAVNQLLSVTNPNLTFVYDDDGNMIQGHTPDGYVFTADYDAENRMTSLEYTDSSSVVHRTEYRYSGDGFLAVIRKFENSTLVDEIRIVRDGLLAVQERDENNAVVREYTWGLNLGGGIGGLLNLKQGGQDYSYLYDGKGNVAAVLDASQAVVAAYRYAPFGKLLAKTGSLEQPFGFSTKRYDAQTGLIYYGYRLYAPTIGRWTTRDPLGEAGGMNLYAFVGNNPVNWVDPWGLVKCHYYITEHELYCFSNDYSQSVNIGPEGIHSGFGECKNAPSCSDDRSKGPIPPDEYNMFPNTKPGREGWWALQSTGWIPKVSGLLHKLHLIRAGFNLHAGSFSQGCITVEKDNPTAMKQFTELVEMLKSDTGENILIVKPRK